MRISCSRRVPAVAVLPDDAGLSAARELSMAGASPEIMPAISDTAHTYAKIARSGADLGDRDTALALHQSDHLRHLAALAWPGRFLCLGGPLGFGGGLRRGGLLVR
jgi:hypothetical protein